MGMLSMNPDNSDLATGPKLSARIANEVDEYMGPTGDVEEGIPPPEVREKPPAKKMKIGSFELDTTYPRTLAGFIRICQIFLLFVSVICLLITPWTDKGTYTFFCIFLVFGILISGYLFFTVIAGTRGPALCGLSWITVELVYFGLFGFLIFLGSCLAANKSEDHAALTASAVFGFFATITFVYYFWITWKLRREKNEEGEEKKKEEEAGSEVDEDGTVKRPLTPRFEGDDFAVAIQDRDVASENNSRRPSMDFGRNNHSLPLHLSDQLYENHKFDEKGLNGHRRRHSASDKDSAYSEGTITPTRAKVIPPKMRRTTSAYDIDNQYDLHHVLHKQPLAHLSHRPYGADMDGMRRSSSMRRQKTGYGYPRELATNSFSNMGYNRDGSRFEEDDLHRSSGRRKSMPDWLRAALGEEVAGRDDIIDDESEEAMVPMQRVTTLPASGRREFPLLNTSDEESINYPSISQNGLGGQLHTSHTLPPQQHRKRHHGGMGHHHHDGGHHHGRRRMGSHNHHGRRHHHHHHKHHRHQHRGDGGRRPVNDAHEDYLRKMMENDELVMKEGTGKDLRGFHPHEGKPIEAGRRRVIPEQPMSIHFPEHSRWEDEAGHLDNPVMQKYFADAKLN